MIARPRAKSAPYRAWRAVHGVMHALLTRTSRRLSTASDPTFARNVNVSRLRCAFSSPC